jgi:hypothetical protein
LRGFCAPQSFLAKSCFRAVFLAVPHRAFHIRPDSCVVFPTKSCFLVNLASGPMSRCFSSSRQSEPTLSQRTGPATSGRFRYVPSHCAPSGPVAALRALPSHLVSLGVSAKHRDLSDICSVLFTRNRSTP